MGGTSGEGESRKYTLKKKLLRPIDVDAWPTYSEEERELARARVAKLNPAAADAPDAGAGPRARVWPRVFSFHRGEEPLQHPR